jgi:hypothetical protein
MSTGEIFVLSLQANRERKKTRAIGSQQQQALPLSSLSLLSRERVEKRS